MLMIMGIPYDSEEGVILQRPLCHYGRNGYKVSALLAQELGVFEGYEK